MLTPYTDRLARLIKGWASLRDAPSFPLGTLINPVMNVGDQFGPVCDCSTTGLVGSVLPDPVDDLRLFGGDITAGVPAAPGSLVLYTIPSDCAFQFTASWFAPGGSSFIGHLRLTNSAGSIIGSLGALSVGTTASGVNLVEAPWIIVKGSTCQIRLDTVGTAIPGTIQGSTRVRLAGSVRSRGY